VSTWEALIAFGLALFALSGLVTHQVLRIVTVVLAAVLFVAAGLIAEGVL
jgi:hypothetical protein